jgi:Ala-tRNA(Pro) deacylase
MSDMPATEDDLFKCFDALGIAHVTHRHPPVFTVEESLPVHLAMPGAHCKALFLKDKNDVFLLAVVLASRRTNLKALGLRADIPGGRLSFASPEALWARLGVRPGSVTPFALLNETSRGVHVLLDKAMMGFALVNYHPLQNAATTAISPEGLLRFIRHCGHEPLIVDFDALEPNLS